MTSGEVIAVELVPAHASAKLDAADDIAPLVRAAHLHAAAAAPGQLEEVVGLQHHVVEFEEAQRLLALEPQLHAVEAQHAVDREMPAVLAQERDVLEPVEPQRVVGHDRVGRAVAERQEPVEDAADAGHVGGDLGVAQKLARLVLARGIADLGGAAAHQHDRLVAGALPQPQQHDLQKTADMQAVGGTIEADIGRERPRREPRVERVAVGALMHEAALFGGGEKGRAGDGHRRQRAP